jgi:glutaredoxin
VIRPDIKQKASYVSSNRPSIKISYFFFVDNKMPIKVYITNIAGNQLTIGNQRKLKHILDTNKIAYVDIDVSDPKNSEEKEFLQRTLALSKQKMSLPQIFKDEQYCCDFDGLLSAVESNTLQELLKLDN